MKLRIMSDIHNEFGILELSQTEKEKETILILAGDIGIAHKKKTYLDFLINVNDRFKCIIYIMGNHEHYRGKFPTTLSTIRKCCIELKNIHILEKETLVVDDVAFICATLWTDFDNENPVSMWHAGAEMNDFHIIRTGPQSEPWKRKFTPNDALLDFKQAKEFIFSEIDKHNKLKNKVVVVSHHAPSHESSASHFRGVATAGAYASDLQDEIIESKPLLWIHGHMHSSADYMIGDTRVILNPRGYVGYELNPDFDPNFIVNI